MNVIGACKELLTQDHDVTAVEGWTQVLQEIRTENDRQVRGFVRIAGRSDVRVPAGSASTVKVTGLQHGECNQAMIEALTTILPGNLLVVNTLSQAVKGNYVVRIVNMGTQDVWLKPRTRVGWLQEVDTEKGEHNKEFDFRQVAVDEVEVNIGFEPGVKSDLDESNESPFPVDLSHLVDVCSKTQLGKLRALLEKHAKVFATDDESLGYTETVRHRIRLKDDIPVSQPYRGIPPTQYEEVKEHIKKLLRKGIIKESMSPYVSPIVLVRKKDQSLRLCVDYRHLIAKTVRDAYPLPRIEESLDRLHGAKWFSVMDLASGFNQVAMEEQDREKTAFSTPMGLFECLRMPFGLTNSPATFQRLMQLVLGDQMFQILLVYLDDIIVYSQTFEEHLDRLDVVFSRLGKHGLRLKPEKCHFFKREVRYLGHLVSEHGVSPDPDKVAAVANWEVPKTVKELQRFLGFASYYRRFIEHFSQIAKPLHEVVAKLTKNHKKRDKPIGELWDDKCQGAFEELRMKLTSTDVLGYSDYTKPFVLETDASFKGLGAVLSQEQDGRLRVIAYASRSLRGSEKNMENYSSFKLELLALKWAITEKFRDYLIGSTFTVYTDNNPLSYIQSTAKLGAIEQRWAGQLALFSFQIKYRSGRSNRNADALSRQSRSEDIEVNSVALPQKLREEILTVAIDHYHLEVNQVAGEVRRPPEMTSETLPSFTPTEISELQRKDPVINRFLHYWNLKRKPSYQERKQEPHDVLTLLRQWDRIDAEDGVWYRTVHDPKEGNFKQCLLPLVLRKKVMESLHD